MENSLTYTIFLSTLSLRRATCQLFLTKSITALFLSTLSLRRATALETDRPPARSISIHALLAESDVQLVSFYTPFWLFLSTLSLRRATRYSRSNKRCFFTFLSTLSLRRATSSLSYFQNFARISIHALLAESDPKITSSLRPGSGISIHALLAESDKSRSNRLFGKIGFLSTLSLRRATPDTGCRRTQTHHFYPRSPCGERRSIVPSSEPSAYFYPRSPCGERPLYPSKVTWLNTFLSTLSLRRATVKCHKKQFLFCS